MAVNVGVIGLGMMGSTHLDAYAKQSDAKIVAISDIDPDKLSGKAKAKGNIEGQAQGGVDLTGVARHDEGMKLIADPNVQLVDICLPTPLHLKYAKAAIDAGKHVLVEKPLARNMADAMELAKLAEQASTVVMPAMCMRFWPGWDWLKQVVAEQRYGKVYAAHFRRVTSHPGGPFYSSGEQAGGALLDLHIHDTDFVQWCFGVPATVRTFGYTKITGEPDHVFTHYLYGDGPVVTAEGCWAFAAGFGFQMQFTVNCESATLVFDIGQTPALRVIQNGKSEAVELDSGMGYDHEIAYALSCVKSGAKPTTVTPRDAANSVAIVTAERESMLSGKDVAVKL